MTAAVSRRRRSTRSPIASGSGSSSRSRCGPRCSATIGGTIAGTTRVPPAASGRSTGSAGVLADADAIETPDLSTEDRDHARHAARGRRICGSARTSTASGSSTPSTSSADRRRCPGSWHASSASTRPSGSPALIARLDGYPAYLDMHIVRTSRRACAPAGAPRRPVVERVITQVRRALETPTAEHPLLLAHPELDAELPLPCSRRPSSATSSRQCRRSCRRSRSTPGAGTRRRRRLLAARRRMPCTATRPVPPPRSRRTRGAPRLRARPDRGDRPRACRDRRASSGYADVDGVPRAPRRATRPTSPRTRSTWSNWPRGQVEKAGALAPSYFGRLPRAACEVRAVEPHQEQEAPSGLLLPAGPRWISRPGIYFINTFDPSSGRSTASPRRPTTRPCRGTISRSRSRRSWRTDGIPPARRRG